ncbi:MAG: nucleotidyltransferase domain-containing protein [Streptococcaceae bacterium]|jgi:predicted nucleotidyltransferase|nr:nucleotidyltransferase domain-containing protein [Streptococcaceae bacterium]
MAILTIDEIKEKIEPIAKKYKIPKVFLFGSYARNTPTEKSDVDLVIESSHIPYYDILFDIEEELETNFGRHVDLIEYEVLSQNRTADRREFNSAVIKDMVRIYDEEFDLLNSSKQQEVLAAPDEFIEETNSKKSKEL